MTAEDLPFVLAEEVQLARVFQNLIGNALKFRREGVAPQIRISADQKEDRVLFTVADNGIGIEVPHQGRIFEAFERLNPSDKYPGSGMGLAICKRIIEQWGGKICVESNPGHGTNFLFTLPAAPVLAPA